MPRNLIVLSDGTGNSASKPFKTNVWRLYQALNLRNGGQVAVFGDGVGTSSVKILRVLGLALGVGVKRNVLNLYKFLCRNYNSGDRIWAFGFSRGAFTIRVLAGLIHHEGLVTFRSEEELNRNALAAYRAYRKRAFSTKIPWVLVGRLVRDWLIFAWNRLSGARSYADVKDEMFQYGRNLIDIHFLGVWDTVVAYGLPIDELTQAVDKWVWPMNFRDRSLLPNVRHARHALSLDDERRTFFPIPWDEQEEERLRNEGAPIAPNRLRQVWFAGAHADVGGGYPDDGLSFVPLCWMMQEAADQGVEFEPTIADSYAAIAAPTGRIYDPRSGFGVFWRYQPRNAQMLMGAGTTPLVHGSVITRMTYGNDGYAPISLPERIDVLPPLAPPVAFEVAAVTNALAAAAPPPGTLPTPQQQRQLTFLRDLQDLVTAAGGANRTNRAELVQDTVWWRRLVYFVSLFLALMAGAYPLLQQYLQIHGVTDSLNDQAGGPVGWTLGLIKGFLPAFAEPWLSAIEDNPVGAALIIVGLLASLAISGLLQQRICDRSRAAWNVRSQVDGMHIDRLLLTGQRHALMTGAVVFAALAAGVLLLGPAHVKLFAFFALLSIVCLAVRAYRIRFPPGAIDPANPGLLLGLARKARQSAAAVAFYRWIARTFAPLIFCVACALIVLSLAHRATFDLLSTGGRYCHSTLREEDQSSQNEKLGKSALLFSTSSICHATGLRLIEGRKYRVQLDMTEDWFDKGERTDVTGFAADASAHKLTYYLASPLKRWWRENWFQPIARVGALGNYERVLQPAAPLPVVRFNLCRPPDDEGSVWNAIKDHPSVWQAIKSIPSVLVETIARPATPDFKRAQLACERSKNLQPSRFLISDITADATGELFIYVNDAVLTLPGLTDIFYRNNSGAATVQVKRIIATPVIESE